MSLSMKTRLECPHSFATDDSPHLHCDFDGICDGKLYECCLDYDMGLALDRIMEDRQNEERRSD